MPCDRAESSPCGGNGAFRPQSWQRIGQSENGQRPVDLGGADIYGAVFSEYSRSEYGPPAAPIGVVVAELATEEPVTASQITKG